VAVADPAIKAGSSRQPVPVSCLTTLCLLSPRVLRGFCRGKSLQLSFEDLTLAQAADSLVRVSRRAAKYPYMTDLCEDCRTLQGGQKPCWFTHRTGLPEGATPNGDPGQGAPQTCELCNRTTHRGLALKHWYKPSRICGQDCRAPVHWVSQRPLRYSS